MKIAIYKWIDGCTAGDTFVSEFYEHREDSKSMLRVSEVIEVDIPLRKAAETLDKELTAIDAIETELRGKFTDALALLADRRSKLLALTHQTAI